MRKIIYQEEEAFLALQRGEEKGLDYFFNQYYTPLIFFSTSITNNQCTAQDIVSETFIKLWHFRQTIESCKKIKPLLYRIVHNASIDHVRRQKRFNQAAHTISGYTSLHQGSVLDQLIETETNHQLYLLISQLPFKCRQVFQMFYFHDKAIKDIAKELGISINTVKSQKQRALQIIKENQDSLHSLIAFVFLSYLY